MCWSVSITHRSLVLSWSSLPMAKGAPGGGAFPPVADRRLGRWGGSDRVSGEQRMTCRGPDRRGRGITAAKRDAQGLTFPLAIPARVMQPGIGTRGAQNWHMALSSIGMALARGHRVHRPLDASWAHLRWAHRLGLGLAGLLERERIGWAPAHPLKFKLRHRGCSGGRGKFLFPPRCGRFYEPAQATADRRCCMA